MRFFQQKYFDNFILNEENLLRIGFVKRFNKIFMIITKQNLLKVDFNKNYFYITKHYSQSSFTEILSNTIHLPENIFQLQKIIFNLKLNLKKYNNDFNEYFKKYYQDGIKEYLKSDDIFFKII